MVQMTFIKDEMEAPRHETSRLLELGEGLHSSCVFLHLTCVGDVPSISLWVARSDAGAPSFLILKPCFITSLPVWLLLTPGEPLLSPGRAISLLSLIDGES